MGSFPRRVGKPWRWASVCLRPSHVASIRSDGAAAAAVAFTVTREWSGNGTITTTATNTTAAVVSRIVPAGDLSMPFPLPANLTRGGGYSFAVELVSVADAKPRRRLAPSPLAPLSPPIRTRARAATPPRTTTTHLGRRRRRRRRKSQGRQTAGTRTGSSAASAEFYIRSASDAELDSHPPPTWTFASIASSPCIPLGRRLAAVGPRSGRQRQALNMTSSSCR